MEPLFPAYVPTWRNNTYSAIDPTRAALSARGKTIVVTGGGRGIGRAVAQAYAAAGAAHIAILGRNADVLATAQHELEQAYPQTRVSTHAADVTDEAALKKAAAAIGPWDVLISNAGLMTAPKKVLECNVQDWWLCFEVTVKGALLTATAFAPHRKPGAHLISMTASMFLMLPTDRSHFSAHTASKIAVASLMETLAAEAADLHVVSVHPGVVDTSRPDSVNNEGQDHVDLAAHFSVWLASPEAAFLRGKYVSANWDVEELVARADEVRSSHVLETSVRGYPWSYGPPEHVVPKSTQAQMDAVRAM